MVGFLGSHPTPAKPLKLCPPITGYTDREIKPFLEVFLEKKRDLHDMVPVRLPSNPPLPAIRDPRMEDFFENGKAGSIGKDDRPESLAVERSVSGKDGSPEGVDDLPENLRIRDEELPDNLVAVDPFDSPLAQQSPGGGFAAPNGSGESDIQR